MSAFYSQFFNPGDLVFDIGANLGNRSAAFHAMGAEVVAFEPQPACCEQLRQMFSGKHHFNLEQCVLGASPGTAELLVCDANTISSLSKAWVDAVQASGRFAQFTWDKRQRVPMKTLDQMITKYGQPAFVKIDVEGSELDVFRGLSNPLKSGSFEFVPEFIESSFQCIRHLESLGKTRFNYAIGERLEIVLDEFVSGTQMISVLKRFIDKTPRQFGDIYFLQNLPGN